MADDQRSMEGGRSAVGEQPETSSGMGVVRFTDQYSLASPEPRDTRYVHPSEYSQEADVWRFVVRAEAYFRPAPKSVEEAISAIDAVFAGMQGKHLPTVEYWIESINDEPIGENNDDNSG